MRRSPPCGEARRSTASTGRRGASEIERRSRRSAPRAAPRRSPGTRSPSHRPNVLCRPSTSRPGSRTSCSARGDPRRCTSPRAGCGSMRSDRSARRSSSTPGWSIRSSRRSRRPPRRCCDRSPASGRRTCSRPTRSSPRRSPRASARSRSRSRRTRVRRTRPSSPCSGGSG